MVLAAALACLASLSTPSAAAATRTWTGLGLTNNWNEAANWSGLAVPGAADVASFDGTSSKNAIINVALNVGGISVGPGYGGTITQAAGVAVTIGASGWSQAGGAFIGGGAAFTVNGPFALTGGSYAATTGTLSISGNLTNGGGTFSHNAGTVALTGGAATIDVVAVESFNHLRFTAGAKTIASGDTLTVGGALTLTAGSLNTGTVAARGPISQASTYGGGTGTLLINGSADQTFTGAATATAGNLPPLVIDKPSGTLSLAGTIRTSTGWTYTAGTVDPGASTVVFVGGTVRSVGMTFNDIIVNGGTTTLGTAIVVAGDLVVSAGTFTTSASNHALSVAGSVTVTGTLRGNGSSIAIGGDLVGAGTFVAGTSTVTLDGAAGQVLGGPTAFSFYNLVVADPAGVFMGANVAVTNVLTLTTGQLVVGAHTLTISRALAGTATNLSANGTSTISVTGTGAGISLPTSISQLSALIVANPNGMALQGDLTVLGTLTLTNGPVNAGSFTLTIGPSGSVARTAGRVVGWLEKHVPAGIGTSVAFEIGDAARYAPVAITFGTVASPGLIRARTTSGDHPDVANSGIAPGASVNRYWTVENDAVAFDAFDAVFTFVPADLDPGADPTTFIVAKLDGATWTLPSVGTRTATSTQAVGMTTFSDFVVGEPTADLAVSVSDGIASAVAGDGSTHTYVVTVSNGGPSDASSVALDIDWPAGFSQGAISPSQGSCAPIGAGPDVSCDIGTLAAGSSVTVSVDYTVGATIAGGPQTITVTVTSATSDPVAADNVASDTTLVIEVADLDVSKDDGETAVVAGAFSGSYTITVTNNGPSDSDSVVLDDTIPAPLVAGPPSADLGADCSGSIGNLIRCTLPASLAVGATWTVDVPYDVPADTAPQTITNTAIATSDEHPGGVGASDETDVTTSADLAVSVSDGIASAVAGDGSTHTYVVTVSNGGPSDASSVALDIDWPAGFSQGAISPSQGSCAPIGAGPDVSCDIGTLAAGSSVTVSVDYTVGATIAGGPQTITVTVTSATSDPVAADNVASDTTLVIGSGGTDLSPPETATERLAGLAATSMAPPILGGVAIVVLGAALVILRRRRSA